MKTQLTALLALSAFSAAFAQDTSLAGLWKNIDDATNKPKALIRITENGGEYRGKIEKLFRPADQEQNPVCDKCEGALKDQPIVGMTILTGIRKEGAEYAVGQILDPANGKLYKSRITMEEGGKKLSMRGYIGMPMLGRTQVWVREE